VKSEWVRAEADMARNQRKLIQTALDNVMPPLPFNQIQYADLSGWQGEADHFGWRKVKMSLADLCGPREGQVAAGPADEVPVRQRDWPVPVPVQPRVQPEPARPVPYQPQYPEHAGPQAAQQQSPAKWPLFAGIGIGAVALAAAGGMLLGQRGSAPAPAPAPVATSVPSPAAVAAVEAPPALTDDDVPAADTAAAPVEEELAAGDDVPLEPNPSDMTFADSSTRLLAPSEVATLGPTTLRIARNEIYARKGWRFKDPWLRDWFSRFAWYRPRYDTVRLNPIEQHNVALIARAEARYQ
jgi:hypothetical protein